jgi:hypothetical protein
VRRARPVIGTAEEAAAEHEINHGHSGGIAMAATRSIRNLGFQVLALATAVGLLLANGFAEEMHTSRPFAGAKANSGTVSHSKVGGRSTLTLSDDFVVPDTPDPHWQLVDSKGTVYLLNKLKIKGDKVNKSIEVPAYVHDVAKVQIWCAFAETNLGEASFESPVK